MMSNVSALARASAEGSRAGTEREERVAPQGRGAPKIQRTLGNRIAGLLAELSQPEALDGAAAQAAARRGLIGAGQELPHLAAIQRSFGRYDVRGVAAHAGAAAQAAAQSLGTAAYTSGEQVAFAGAPDLRTAAHEAAHVIQQRAGIELPGGIDRPGDRFERHADAVAEQVVAGRSAEPLLDAMAGSRAAAGPSAGAGAAVQRRLMVTAKALTATRTRDELKALQKGETDGLAQVIELLEAYERATDSEEQLIWVNKIRALLEYWQRPIRAPRSSRVRRRFDLIGQLEAEVVREREQITWQVRYMSQDRPFVHLDPSAQRYAFEPARRLKAGEPGDVDMNTGAKSKAVVTANDLSAAEVAAIRVFSLSDYKYINPAVANDRAWMLRNYPMADDRELTERMQEGSAHAAVMLDGLAKLPPWSGQAFRGERMTQERFGERYVGEKTIRFPSFASLATDRTVAEKFAKGNDETPADATVSVVVTLDVTYARNIGKLSVYRNEKEVLVMPGAEFEVVDRKKLKAGKKGSPRATAWYEVRLRQVR